MSHVFLDLPEGRRRMDLKRQGGGSYVFEAVSSGIPRPLQQLSTATACVTAAVLGIGLLYGITEEWAFQLILFMAFMSALLVAVGILTNTLGSSDRNRVVINAEREEITFPPGGSIEGAYPASMVEIFAEADEAVGGKRSAGRDWWVVARTPASDEPGERLIVTMKIYGPGHKGEIMAAAQSILNLCDWKDS